MDQEEGTGIERWVRVEKVISPAVTQALTTPRDAFSMSLVLSKVLCFRSWTSSFHKCSGSFTWVIRADTGRQLPLPWVVRWKRAERKLKGTVKSFSVFSIENVEGDVKEWLMCKVIKFRCRMRCKSRKTRPWPGSRNAEQLGILNPSFTAFLVCLFLAVAYLLASVCLPINWK